MFTHLPINSPTHLPTHPPTPQAINHFGGLEFHDCSLLDVFCVSKGDDYLALAGLSPSMLPRNIAVCVGFLALLIGMGFWSLRRVSL